MNTAIIMNRQDLDTLLEKQKEVIREQFVQIKNDLINQAVGQTVSQLYELLAPMLPATADIEYIAQAERVSISILYQEAGRAYLPNFGKNRPGKGRKLCWPIEEYLAWRAKPLAERKAQYDSIKSGHKRIEEPAKKRGRGRPRGSTNI